MARIRESDFWIKEAGMPIFRPEQTFTRTMKDTDTISMTVAEYEALKQKANENYSATVISCECFSTGWPRRSLYYQAWALNRDGKKYSFPSAEYIKPGTKL